MLKINNIHERGPREVVIDINPDFYPEDAIDRAVEVFSSVCDFDIKKEESRTTITLKLRQDVNPKLSGYEFMNHLLAQIKNGVNI